MGKDRDHVSAEYWNIIENNLPSELDDEQKRWLRAYLDAQISYKQKDFIEVYKTYGRLDTIKGYISRMKILIYLHQ